MTQEPLPSPGPGGGSLFSITRTLHALELSIEENGGELSPEMESLISKETIARDKKVDAYAAIWERFELIAEEGKRRADRILEGAKAAERIVTKLKGNLKLAIRFLGTNELQSDDVRFQLITTQKVEIVDPAAIPEKFIRQVVKMEPDLVHIRSALVAGQEVPGAKLVDSYTIRRGAPKKGTR